MVAFDLAEIADRDAGRVAQLLQRHVQPPAAGADQRADLGLSRLQPICRLLEPRSSLHQNFFDLSKVFCMVQQEIFRTKRHAQASRRSGVMKASGTRRHSAWHSNPTPLQRRRSPHAARCPGAGAARWRLLSSLLGYAVAVALTFLGLLAITFFIGRVVPIDPVLAAVGDRAPPAVYEAARLEMGLDKPLPVQFVALCRRVS